MDKQQATEWAKSFLNRVETQDNRATASPILYLLRRKQSYVAHDEYCHGTDTVFRHPAMEYGSCETHEKAVEWLKKDGYDGDRLKEEIENIEKFEIGHYYETENVFLTQDGLERHRKLNGHNLGKHDDYVIHAFRNPEISELYECLAALIGEVKP